jgi:ABC-type transport system involved in cytochrome c biogenesis permease component
MWINPVIWRELRGEARSPATHRLRLLASVVLIGTLVLFAPALGTGNGGRAFIALHTLIYTLTWALVPVLLHDTICREQRDGTLSLLLMTPLKGGEVLLAKAFAGLIRSSVVLLAAMPVLAIPLLAGGVSAAEILRAVAMEVMALLGATAATLLASCRSRQRGRALLAAFAWCGAFSLLLTSVPVLYFPVRGNPVEFVLDGLRMSLN